MANEVTKHFIIDIKTGRLYGIKMNSEGECLAVQPLQTNIQDLAGKTISEIGPEKDATGKALFGDLVPYGETMHAIELIAGETKGQVFTVVWPSEEESKNKQMPKVTKKQLPSDLVAAGFAAAVKASKGEKGAGVDDEETLATALQNIDKMIGLDQAKKDIRQNIAVARFNRAKEEMGISTQSISRHMVFTGNPGTGKTTFAREVAKVYHALGFIDKPVVTEVKREDLVAGFVGQTALKTREVIDKAKGGVLFIDEAYALSKPSSGGGGKSNDFGAEAIDTLVAAMENMREDLIVIVAGYPGPMKAFIDANEGLKSRFMTYISFNDYEMNDLEKIMDVMLKDRGYTIEPDAREHALALIAQEKHNAKNSKDFGNGRTVRNLVEKAEKELAMRLESEQKLGKNHGLSNEDLKKALTTFTLADLANVSLNGIDNDQSDSISFLSDFKKEAANKNVKPAQPSIEELPAVAPQQRKNRHKGM